MYFGIAFSYPPNYDETICFAKIGKAKKASGRWKTQTEPFHIVHI
jgi:hypothetical protein